jgi:transglutaminase-like putative cysteine protease
LVVLSYLALTSVSSFGMEIVLVAILVLALMPMMESLDRRTTRYRQATSLITVAFALVVLPQMVMRFGVLIALTILCAYIQAHLLLHDKSVRDYQYLFLMAFFLVVSACAQNPEPSLGLILPFFMLAIVWSFGMLQIRKDVTIQPDVALGVLLAKSTKDRLVPTEGLSPLEQPRLIGGNLASYLVLIAACCFLLSLAIFALTPRMEVGMLGGSDIQFAPPSATDSVNLSRGGRIGTSASPVMRVRFPEEPGGRYNGDLFWRVTTLSRYSDFEWSRSRVNEEDFADRQSRARRIESETNEEKAEKNSRIVIQEIYLDVPPPYGIPCLPFQRSAEVTDHSGTELEFERAGDLTVIPRRQRSPALSYRVYSEVAEPAPDRLRQYPEHFASLRGQRGFPFFYERVMGIRAYNAYTQENLSEETRQLAREITDPYDNPYDKAQAIVRWLSGSGFEYSLTLPSSGGSEPVEMFLHETRSGHCELYASAMALLLRTVGIPSRVVSGYRGGEWSNRDQSYIVRQSMAHMWVEVYFIDYGWVTFDPSPETELPETEISSLSRFISRNILNLKMMWFRDVVGYSGGIRLADLRNFTLGLVWFDFDTMKSVLIDQPILSGAIPKMVFWGTVALSIPLGLILMVVRRPRRVVAFVHFTPDQVRATRLFGRMKRQLRRLEFDCSGKSAGEIYASLDGGLVEHADPIRHVIQAYRDARFGGRPLDRKRYLELSRVIRALRETKGRDR